MRKISLLALSLIVLAPSVAASQEPTNLDELVLRRGVYLQRPTFEPYSGPVVGRNEDGLLRERGTLREGRWEGVREIFFETGQLAVRETYSEGRLDGPFESYFRMGSPSDRGSYRDGRLDGPYESYWLRQLAERGTWSEGEMCGEWVHYFPASSYGRRVETAETFPACPAGSD